MDNKPTPAGSSMMENVESNNQMIAEFMGWKYSEPNVLVDEGDYDYTNYVSRTIFSKTPIEVEDGYFKDMPNPDYMVEGGKWRSDLPALSWASLNEYLTDVDIEKYHKSWDWLMPVLIKISAYKYEDGETAYPRTFGMPFNDGIKDSPETIMVRLNRQPVFHGATLLEATYTAITIFIASLRGEEREKQSEWKEPIIDNSTDHIDPCPFCGGKHREDIFMRRVSPDHFQISCLFCGATMKQDRRDKVIGMWNHRGLIEDRT